MIFQYDDQGRFLGKGRRVVSHFEPLDALVGGMLIAVGLAAVLLCTGRIAGVSGVLGGLVRGNGDDVGWRVLFVVGMVAGGLLFASFRPAVFEDPSPRPDWIVVLGGLLVGFGTRAGNGCTSGHGVCGNSRLSVRSIVATLTFMAIGMATATLSFSVWGRS